VIQSQSSFYPGVLSDFGSEEELFALLSRCLNPVSILGFFLTWIIKAVEIFAVIGVSIQFLSWGSF